MSLRKNAQAAAVNKAINAQETPVKEKHVRMSIIGTFQDQGARVFWNVGTRLPLQGNPIICWKFCYTLHKLLREGHAQTIPDSYKFVSHLTDLGKLWGLLREGYGKLISCYCKLLVCKLEFHRKYPKFPGNLQVNKEILDNIGENDVNIFFELCTEFFDYMEELLNLQKAVFGSLDMSRANSMTSTGQCRIHPLIPCIQDSSQLYDFSVKTMFKLHAALPADTLAGHRQRFLNQFKVLRNFYLSASNLQYFKYLIHVPQLPENPPNFLVASDLYSHVSPVVVVPPQDDDRESIVEGSLVDAEVPPPSAQLQVMYNEQNLVDLTIPADQRHNGASSPSDVDREKDQLIESLMRQIERLKQEIHRLKAEHQQMVDQLRATISDLQAECVQNKQLVEQAYNDNEDLKKQVTSGSAQQTTAYQTLVVKLANIETKSKTNEEKFHKMKDVYNKLREEHIKLLRTHAEVSKSLNATKTKKEEDANTRKEVEEELMRLKAQHVAAEQMQQAASNKDKELSDALTSRSYLEQKVQELESQMSVLKQEKDTLLEESASLGNDNAEIHEELKKVISEKMLLTAEKTELEDQLERLAAERSSLVEENNLLTSELGRSQAERKQQEADAERQLLEAQLQLLAKGAAEAEAVVRDCLEQFDNPQHATITCTPEYLLTRTEYLSPSLTRFREQFKSFREKPADAGALMCSMTMFAHLMGDCLIQGKATSHLADIDKEQELVNTCRQVGAETISAFTLLKNKDDHEGVQQQLNEVEAGIEKVVVLVEALVPKMEDVKKDELGDLVDQEMQGTMDLVESAARRIEEMLNNSRKSDSGVTLEVNERILDSCNALMMAVKILIERSKDLQIEIATQGRGSTSVKEFYKRNHRWTEGLISAAKSVGFSAKILVDAADSIVGGDGKLEELLVCSQEIAASTAQLVVASKVKASRDSERLTNLSRASHSVSQATGGVVASVKTGARLIDDRDIMDFSKLSLHQAKRLEMDSQVRVLELENAVVKERKQLASLRTKHYQLAGSSEGWDEEDIPRSIREKSMARLRNLAADLSVTT
ncbi:PREDICTED: huntingtin-interacting protein 1-like [Priapulus caudatus]|uniref:Huntingtin-interacting protein 1-like n=1 Tax=Priapulus caudatus TaxID=37621 RepID=A0ABM1DVM7_PRICU|nr:PREDICTED: huntingtin-interacting protein 1-like [Priapulus caudatus]